MLCTLHAQKQEYFLVDESVGKVYASIIEFDFDAAEYELQDARFSQNAIRHLLHNQIGFLKIFSNEDADQYLAYLKNKQERLSNIEKADRSVPFYHYCLAEIHLQSAILNIRFQDRVKGILSLRKALNHIKKNQVKHPDFFLNYKLSGLLKAFSGAVPENYHWISDLLGFDGTVEDGLNDLQQLERLVRKKQTFHFLLPEIIFYQAFIQLNLSGNEPDYKNWYQKIDALPSKGPLIQFCAAMIASKEKNLEMQKKFLDIKQSAYTFCYLDFLRGELALFNTKDDAPKYFHRYLNCFKGKTYVKAAYQKIAWHYLLKGEIQTYFNFMSLLKHEGEALTDEDKMAQQEAIRSKAPDINLLKARILFDAGRYDEALEKMNAMNPTAGLLYEFHYRLGRIQHLKKESDNALLNYAKSIELRNNDEDYFAAASHFYSGEILILMGRNTEACYHFNKVLHEKNHPYKNSLDAKAKARLQQCN
jgi:predicted negative regulator of RcsB-dependent stress response